jgi:prepilin peptidase CpaA
VFGRIESDIFVYAVAVISAIACFMDLKTGRIFNWLTLPALLFGLVFLFVTSGWLGLGDGLLGVLAGLLLYGWMFFLGYMGGGDVKLLMAMGAWGGSRFVLEVAVLGVLVGGCLAVVQLLVTGRLLGFMKRMYRFILTLIVKELVLEPPRIDRKVTMPFGVSIAIAAVSAAIWHPFEKFGVHLWH